MFPNHQMILYDRPEDDDGYDDGDSDHGNNDNKDNQIKLNTVTTETTIMKKITTGINTESASRPNQPISRYSPSVVCCCPLLQDPGPHGLEISGAECITKNSK